MFVNKIVGVNAGKITTQHRTEKGALGAFVPANRNNITASVGAGIGGGQTAGSTNIGFAWPSQYQFYFTGLLPADPTMNDNSSLLLFYRDIYLHDNVGGPAVDIQSTFPFSDFDLRGQEPKILKVYEEACEQLNVRKILPQVSRSHMIDGHYTGSLVFDPRSKKFRDIYSHDALSCTVHNSPFNNMDPTITVSVGGAVQNFLRGNSDFAQQYLNSLPQSFMELLQEGRFDLSPLTTLFVPRKTMLDRPFTSYLHRLLPMYLIEKTMYRGTLVEANRRQRAMTQVTVGTDIWEPTGEEMSAIAAQYMSAETDPLGGWVVTRNGVQATDLRPGGDFWKWTDMADTMTPYKLRALGISENFLSGDQNYSSSEAAYSLYMESAAAYRYDLTSQFFYNRLFPLIAITNKFYREGSKQAQSHDLLQYLYNKSNVNNLMMPEVHWHKSLEGSDEDSMFDKLEKLDEHNIPVPVKTWIVAAGLDPETLIRDLEEDKKLRGQLAQLTKSDVSHDGEDTEVEASRIIAAMLRGNRARPILARDFSKEMEYRIGKTGKPEHIHNQRAAKRQVNAHLAKLVKTMKDPNQRKNVREKNVARMGKYTLDF